MIEVVDVKKSYKKHEAVKGVQLFIESGEIVGLLGPNGAGKSTTISMISSLVKPTEGDVLINGISVKKYPEKIRQLLGVVPQEIALFQDLTAKENLFFFGRAYKLKGDQLKQRVKETLKIVGLTERANEIVNTYSGGMKRRINIAVALLHQPKIMIMDEPTVGIDPQSRNYILETVRKLTREEGMTVIYTSHYMEEVEFLCDRLYIMDRGQILASGSKQEVKAILTQEDTIHLKVHSFPIDFQDALAKHPMISSLTAKGQDITFIAKKDDHLLENIFQLSKEHDVNLQSAQIISPTLEDVFLHLTGRSLRD